MYQPELEIRAENNETIRILRFSRPKYVNVPWGLEYIFFNEILQSKNADDLVNFLAKIRAVKEPLAVTV